MLPHTGIELDHPLLSRLELEAPGSYHHSIRVALLAREGARALGADARIAYLGGLLHDIGKVCAPQSFPENASHGPDIQEERAAPNDVVIFRTHVSYGVELALGCRFEPRVIACIREHHGTLPIVYTDGKESAPDAPGLQSGALRYYGPPPSTPESAIVMLANYVEADSRALDMRAISYLQFIECTVDSLREAGQLDSLAKKDSATVADGFVRVLQVLHPRRHFVQSALPPVPPPRRRSGRQGFASMPRQRVVEIASAGGRSAHLKGTAHQWTSQEAREAGRVGGRRAGLKHTE